MNHEITHMVITRTNDLETQKKALALALDVFMEFEAPDYTIEGVEEFKMTLKSQEFLSKLEYHIALENDQIIGMIATRNEGKHIALLFVEKEWQRKGIGKKLCEHLIQQDKTAILTVNSSPYGHEFYKRIGFVDTDTEQTVNGIRFFPMQREQ